MRIDLLTLFPEFFRSPLSESMLQRAQDLGAVEFRVINLRDYTTDRHHVVDDRPFGGGPGMVMKIDPLAAAIREARREDPEIKIFLLSPGPIFSQAKAGELAGLKHLMLICGHYEGVDDRIKYYIDGMLSIGDYILTGGEIPALAVVDAVTRLLPGVLGGEGSALDESFQTGLLEYPHYTRPREFDGHEAPGGSAGRQPPGDRGLAAAGAPCAAPRSAGRILVLAKAKPAGRQYSKVWTDPGREAGRR